MRIFELRSWLFWFAVVVVVLWAVNDPSGAGGLVHSVFGWLGHAAHSGQAILKTSTGH